MLVPFFSSRKSKLERRKGGGGGGGRGGGSSSAGRGSSGGSSSSSGSRGSGSSSGRTSSVSNTGSKSSSASTYGNGGGRSTIIPSGSIFSGRTSGGGTRANVYGSRQYGSGYPNVASAGIAGRGFPFVFWPIAWGGAVGIGGSAFYHNSEYGRPDNTSRPGGVMVAAAFVSNSTTPPTIFRLVSDNTTMLDLIPTLITNCTAYNLNTSASSTSPSLYADNPQPNSAIQYYRASSVSLTLDGYNNSAVFADDPNSVPDSPLPSGIDTTLLECLNSTIGLAVPLINGASSHGLDSSLMGVVGLLWTVWLMFRF